MNDSISKLDDRWISWKYLLPNTDSIKVLLLSNDECLARALSRSYRHVDLLEDSAEVGDSRINNQFKVISKSKCCTNIGKENIYTKYDLIILAKTCYKIKINAQQISNLLRNNGLIIQIINGNKNDKNIFKGTIYQEVHFYSAIPAYSPRLLFPLYPKKFREKSLSFHNPGSLKAKVALVALEIVSSIGIVAPLKKNGVSILSRYGQESRSNTLSSWLEQKLALRVVNIAIYCGSESFRRKVTLLVEVMKDSHVEDLVVKVADTKAGAEAIGQERTALVALEKYNFNFWKPEVLLCDTWNGHAVQVQTAIPVSTVRQIPVLTDAHISLLKDLSRMERCSILYRDTPRWTDLDKSWRTSNSSKYPSQIISLHDKILKDSGLNEPILCHRVHGDFAPWNIRQKNKRLFVYDWEDSIPNGLPFSDILHFVYRQASLVGPWRGAKALVGELNQKSAMLIEITDYPEHTYQRVLPVLLLSEYLARPSQHILEVISAFLTK